MKPATVFASLFFVMISFAYSIEPLAFSKGFVENKGQGVNQVGAVSKDVKYICDNGASKLLLKNDSFSLELYKSDNKSSEARDSKETLLAFRIDVRFENANANIKTVAEGKQNKRFNYYKAGESVENVCSFKKIVYKNVYDGVDVEFCAPKTPGDNVKYNFIVKPGGDYRDIKMRYEGAKIIRLSKDSLLIKTPLSEIIESTPKAFIKETGKEVPIEYAAHGNKVGFKIKNQIALDAHAKNRQKTLIIDPEIDFGTYFGGSGEDFGLETCVDSSGNIIIVGYTTSTQNIATQGAHQTTLKGDRDAFIAKFDKDGELLWATYFGGNDYENGHSVSVDKDGYIVLTGWTKSKFELATQGAYQYFFGGGEFDSYIARFTPSGNLLWATYYGGPSNDYINDVAIDGYGDIVFVGRTSSKYSLASNDAYQESLNGDNDAFIGKFSPEGLREWGTYFGGKSFDAGIEICADIFNNITIAGFTKSKDVISSDNAHQDTIAGDWDGFLAKFDSKGYRIWATYYGGAKEDDGWGVTFDGDGSIYLIGKTKSEEGISTPGAFKENIADTLEFDSYIAKFNKNGERLWASYYGGDDEEKGGVADIDFLGNLYLAGDSYSETGIATNDGWQTENMGGYDAYIAKFSAAGDRLWASYYGGYNDDHAHCVNAGFNSDFVFTGYSSSSFNVATMGSYQEAIGGQNDAFIVKFNQETGDDTITVDLTGSWCADSYVQIPYEAVGDFDSGNKFTAQLSNAQGFFTQYYNLGSVNATESGTITAHIPKEVKTGDKYRIRVVSSSPEVLGEDNQANLTLYSSPTPEISGVSGEINVCEQSEDYYAANPLEETTANFWEVSGGEILSDSSNDTIRVKWGTPGFGSIELLQRTQNGCSDSISFPVIIHSDILTQPIQGESEVCINETSEYIATIADTITNFWEVNGGEILPDSSNDTIRVKWTREGEGEVKLTQIVPLSGCADSAKMKITVNPLPTPYIIGDTIVESRSSELYRTGAESKYINQWKAKGGEIRGLSEGDLIEISWGEVGSGTITLKQTNKLTGCVDSILQIIEITLTPEKNILGAQTVCSDNVYKYSVKDSSNFELNWGVGNGEIISESESEALVKWGAPSSGTVSLFRRHIEEVFRDTISLVIEILPIPPARILGSNELCEGLTEIYCTVGDENYVNEWIVYNGEIVDSSSNDTIKIQWFPIDESVDSSFVIGSITLRQINKSTGCSNLKTKSVFLSKNPDAKITGDTSVCQYERTTYKAGHTENTTNAWKVVNGVIANYSEDSLVTVYWNSPGEGKLKLIQTTNSGCKDSTELSITIKPSPEKPTITQNGEILFSSAEEGNQWFINGEFIEGADSQYYKPDSSGSYSVQVTGGNGCKSPMSEPYQYITSVEDNPENNLAEVFPNPAKDVLFIKINSTICNYATVYLSNILGERVKKRTIKEVNEKQTIKINADDLPKGVYFITVYCAEQKIYSNNFVKH